MKIQQCKRRGLLTAKIHLGFSWLLLKLSFQRSRHGQASLEWVVLVTMLVLAVVALSQYTRNALAARYKAGADSLSQKLIDPENIQIASVRCQHITEDGDSLTSGKTRSFYTEASEKVSNSKGVTAFTDCPPLPPEPN